MVCNVEKSEEMVDDGGGIGGEGESGEPKCKAGRRPRGSRVAALLRDRAPT